MSIICNDCLYGFEMIGGVPFVIIASLAWLITGLLAGWLGELRVLDGVYGEPALSLLARGALVGLVAVGAWLFILSCLLAILHR